MPACVSADEKTRAVDRSQLLPVAGLGDRNKKVRHRHQVKVFEAIPFAKRPVLVTTG